MSGDFPSQLKAVNDLIPVHSMWDGFWIYDFSNGLLTITCSFDRISYRNFDIEFSGVSFFNIPARWDDDNVPGDTLFRLAGESEFQQQQPGFETAGKHIIALDLQFRPLQSAPKVYTYFIIADSVSAEKCLIGNSQPFAFFVDPFAAEGVSCFKNRVQG